jgi:hypothetical protein
MRMGLVLSALEIHQYGPSISSEQRACAQEIGSHEHAHSCAERSVVPSAGRVGHFDSREIAGQRLDPFFFIRPAV